jgi:hypothetical protein
MGLPSGLFPSGFSTKILAPIRVTCPAHLILPDLITRKILGKEYRSISSSLCSFVYYLVTSSLLGPNILLSTQFSNTLSIRSFLNVSDQVLHPYKATGEIIVLHILIFKFLDSKLEDESLLTYSNPKVSKVVKLLYADGQTAGLDLPPHPSPSRHATRSVNGDGSVLCCWSIKSL